MTRVDQTVFAFLGQIAALGAVVENRIYGIELPEGVILPAVRFLLFGDIGDLAHDGGTGRIEFRAQVDSYGPNTAAGYEQTAEMAAILDHAFVGCDWRHAGVRLCAGQLVGRQRTAEIGMNAYRVLSDYSLAIDQS